MQDITLFIQHHWMLSLALIAVAIALIILEFFRFKQGGTRLNPTQVTRLMNHEEAVIVDIRTPEAYASGHIIDAMSLPLSSFQEKAKKLEKFKSKPIVIVCMTGTDSPRATALLKQQGFNNVQLLAGGIRAWRDANLPLVKE